MLNENQNMVASTKEFKTCTFNNQTFWIYYWLINIYWLDYGFPVWTPIQSPAPGRLRLQLTMNWQRWPVGTSLRWYQLQTKSGRHSTTSCLFPPQLPTLEWQLGKYRIYSSVIRKFGLNKFYTEHIFRRFLWIYLIMHSMYMYMLKSIIHVDIAGHVVLMLVKQTS